MKAGRLNVGQIKHGHVEQFEAGARFGYASAPLGDLPEAEAVKSGIHPKYNEIKVTCSCGQVFVTRSTLSEDIRVEVCSSCHPFFTGSQKIMESAGQIEKFRRRYGARNTA